MSKNDFFITRPEIRFWLYVIFTIIPVVIYIVSLSNQVHAMNDKGVKLREDYEKSIDKIDEKLEYLIHCNEVTGNKIVEIKKDIEYIKLKVE